MGVEILFAIFLVWSLYGWVSIVRGEDIKEEFMGFFILSHFITSIVVIVMILEKIKGAW